MSPEGIGARIRGYGRTLWADGTGWILLLVGVGWALSIGVRFVYPAVLPLVRADLGFGLSASGLLLTCLWGAYALGHVPGGLLGDRLGEGRTLTTSVAVAAVALTTVALAPTLVVLFVATVGFGLATALYGPTRFTILTDLYPHASASAVGVTMAAGNVGNTLLPVVATLIAGAATWRFGFAAFVPVFVVVAAGFWLVAPRRTSDADPTSLSWTAVRRLWTALGHGAIPAVVATQVTLSFMIQGFASFYPTYLVETKGLTTSTAATLFGAFFATGAVVQTVSGRLADRVGNKPTLVGWFAVAVTALTVLPFVSGPVPLAAVSVLFAAWNGTIVVTQTYIADTLPADVQGTGFGLLKAGWMLVGATAPLLVGLLAARGLFDEGFLVLAGVGVCGLALAVLRL